MHIPFGILRICIKTHWKRWSFWNSYAIWYFYTRLYRFLQTFSLVWLPITEISWPIFRHNKTSPLAWSTCESWICLTSQCTLGLQWCRSSCHNFKKRCWSDNFVNFEGIHFFDVRSWIIHCSWWLWVHCKRFCGCNWLSSILAQRNGSVRKFSILTNGSDACEKCLVWRNCHCSNS